MMKHKVKYRVVGADKSKRKYSINLDDGTAFQLSRDLLQGSQTRQDPKPLCAFLIQNGVLWARASADQNDIILNGKSIRESEVRPGDLVQVAEFSIELLECPHTARNENNATQFLDVSEMFTSSSDSSSSAAKSAAPAPAPATEVARKAEPQEAPVESAASAQSSSVDMDLDFAAAASVPVEKAPEAPVVEVMSAQALEQKAPVEDPTTVFRTSRAEESPAPKGSQSSSRSRSNSLEERRPSENSRAAPTPRSRSHSERSDRHSSSRHAARMEERPDKYNEKYGEERRNERRPGRRDVDQAPQKGIESEFQHLAISGGMAAIGVAASARVLVASSTTPQGMLVAVAACASLPVILGAAWGLARMNDFLNTRSSMREYARFLGWAMICVVPWAYTLAAAFPIAVFTTLLMTVLVTVAFMARFRPDTARFAGVGAGFSVLALSALFATHHLNTPKPDQVAAETPAAAPADATNPAAAPAAPNAVTPPAGAVAQNGVAPAQPAGVQPVNPGTPGAVTPGAVTPAGTPPGTPAGAVALNGAANAPQIPSAVNDTIPAIPSSPNAGQNRMPANTDNSTKGIIDPLAHEQFFSAIKTGNIEVVKSLVDRKEVDPDFTLDKGSTPLITAAANGRTKIVEYLLRRRVNINAQDPHGTTALMWAVFKGHRDVAKLLIKRGADTKVIRDDGDTALDIARKWKQGEIVALLKERAKAEDDSGSAPKHSKRSKKRHRSDD